MQGIYYGRHKREWDWNQHLINDGTSTLLVECVYMSENTKRPKSHIRKGFNIFDFPFP